MACSQQILTKYVLFTMLFLFSRVTTAGQLPDEKGFTRYSTADGLSDNDVTGVTQDATGYIWLPTASGLNRFDGSRFIQYHSTADPQSPASENFSGLKWLDNERIAFFTTGLHIINTRTGERKNLFVPWHDKLYQYKFNTLPDTEGDVEGNTFILNRSGFYHFDKNYRLVYRFDFYTEKEVPSSYFVFGRELLKLDKNRLLINSADGYYIYYKDKKELRKLNQGDEPLLRGLQDHDINYQRLFQVSPGCLLVIRQNSDSVYYLDFNRKKRTITKSPVFFTKEVLAWRSKLCKSNDSVFYLTAFVSGFYRLVINSETGTAKVEAEKQFSSTMCYSLLTDRDNVLWVATNKGLYRQDWGRSLVETSYLPSGIQKEFPNIRISAVAAGTRKIYAGSFSKAGILVFDKKTFRFERQFLIKNDEKTAGVNKVFRILPVGHDEIFLGTDGYLLLYNERTGKETWLHAEGWENTWVNDLFKDSKNNVWVSTKNLFRYHIGKREFAMIPLAQPVPTFPSALREDTAGNIWVAAQGISRYNISENNFDFRIDSFPYISFPDKKTTAMVIDRQNRIWFGCVDNGLICYDISSKKYLQFTRSNGLPDNNISSLLITGNKLWIACYSGLACLDLSYMQIRSFGKNDGLPVMPVVNGGTLYYDSSQQKLYLAFLHAISRFNPFEMLMPRKQPSVFIENIDIAGGKSFFLPSGYIKTSWKENNLRISIGSINFNDGESQAYAYRIIKPGDTAWQQLGNQPSFNISNLPPGKHRILVKILSLQNRWPDQVKEILVEASTPFWQKTWFRIMSVFFLLILVFLFIQWRIYKTKKKEMQKTQVEKLKAEDYRNKYELEQITHYFSSSLSAKKTAEDVLWDVAKNLIARLNYVDCMIYLWNDDKTKMIQKAAYGLKGKPELLAEQVFDVKPGQGVVGYVMHTKKPVLIRDTRVDKRYRVDEARRLSEICVPIIHNDELLGIIDSEHPELSYYTERDLKILTTIAMLIGNKIKQLESEQSLEVKEKELSNINEQLAEAKLSALQAQMNPHFVFNALNSIKRMILEDDNEKASRYLSKFALMIRMTLTHSGEAFVTLAENIAYLKNYLGMEQLRFDDSFSWDISVAANIDQEETLIPSLMIQPLVENAIWHGLLQSTEEKKLTVKFMQDKNRITCIIEDNGIGIRRSEQLKKINKSNHRSVGLENLKKRIRILNEKFAAVCSLDIIDLKEAGLTGSGTRVTLAFSIINN